MLFRRLYRNVLKARYGTEWNDAATCKEKTGFECLLG